MNRGGLLVIAVSLSLLAGAPRAQACFCADSSTQPCAAVRRANAVFVGTVGELSDNGNRIAVQLSVQRRFKGSVTDKVEVLTSKTDCGYPFKKGKTYLIYAWRQQPDGQLLVSDCSPTKPLDSAELDLRLLEGKAASSPGSFIAGRVAGEGDVMTKALSVGRVTVVMKGRLSPLPPLTSVADSSGWYQVVGAPPGQYEFHVEIPDAQGLRVDSVKWLTVERSSCYQVDFWIPRKGRKAGGDNRGRAQPSTSSDQGTW